MKGNSGELKGPDKEGALHPCAWLGLFMALICHAMLRDPAATSTSREGVGKELVPWAVRAVTSSAVYLSQFVWSGAEVPGLAGPLSGLASLFWCDGGWAGWAPGPPWPMGPAACTALAGLDHASYLQLRDCLHVPRVVLLGEGAALKGSPAPFGGNLEGQGCP